MAHRPDHADSSGDTDRARSGAGSGYARGADPVRGTDAQLIGLQRTVGNATVARLLAEAQPVVQRADGDMSATLRGRAEQQIAAAKATREPAEDGERPQAPSAEQVAAEKAKQRRAMSGAVAPPDTSAARSTVAGAASEAKAEVAKPPAPLVPGAPAPAPAAGGGVAGAGEAQAASVLAEQAASLAAEQAAPELPPAVAPPEPLTSVNGGGRDIPANPVLEAGVAAVAARLQALRAGAHQVRAAATAERAQGHRMRAMIEAGRGAVADSDAGVAALKEHSAHRRGAVEQARGALNVSKQKAETVASGAPQVAAKSDEGAEKSGPMASESKNLAAQNASHTPEDGEAAGKSAEQGNKLTQVGGDLGSIDSTIGQTKARAGQLAEEAAAASASNTASEGRIAEAEAAIAGTEAKAAEMTAQNAAARSRFEGFAGEPAGHHAAADELDARGTAMHAASVTLEARLAAAQQAYVSGMAGMPAPVPARRPGVAVQRAGYEDRVRYDPAGAVDRTLPSWVTGEDPPNAAAAAEHHAREEQRKAAELAEIERECGGHFEQLTAAQKAGIALRMSGRNLLHGIGDTNFAKFGLGILRGFVDPRASLMGIVHGFGQIVSGFGNLFSAEQWAKDPLGNALKSAADIATGVTIVLGSIAGLAVAIGIILTAIAIVGSIFSFGAVGLALAPIIAFCGTVASTVGPWALWAAGIALVLHALVFIKNLIDAATASTARDLQQKSDQMTEDAQNAGAMALQIGMAKAMEFGGKLLAGRGGGSSGTPEGAPPTEPRPVTAEELPTGTPANDNAIPAAANDNAIPAAANDNAIPAAANDNPIPAAANDNAIPAAANDNAVPGAANDNAVPAAANGNAVPAAANDNAIPAAANDNAVPAAANDNAVPAAANDNAVPAAANDNAVPAAANDNAVPGAANDNAIPGETANAGEKANAPEAQVVEWPPAKPAGKKPAVGEPGAAEWRYQRYLYNLAREGRGPDEALPFDEWKESYYDPVTQGQRPGRRGGTQQVAAKDKLTTEGVEETENVELGGRFPDGRARTPNAAGGTDYFEVGKMLKSGKPEARERVKLQDEIDALGPNDTVTFVDKTDTSRRITYRRGDSADK